MLDLTRYDVPTWDKTKYELLNKQQLWRRTWYKIELPAAYREKVTVDIIVPDEKYLRKPTRLVVSLQILGGKDPVSWIIAHYFALCGYPALIVHRSKELFNLDFEGNTITQTLQQFDENLRNVSIIHRQAIDFAIGYLHDDLNLSELDTTEVYAMGVSLGAITLSGLSVMEPKISKSVIVMGGCDVGEILTTSKEPSVKRNVDALCQHYYIERADLRAEIRRIVKTDNAKLLYAMAATQGEIPDWKYRMVVSLIDTQVPTRAQKKLRRLIGGKKLYIPTGHYTAAIFLPLILGWARKYFERA